MSKVIRVNPITIKRRPYGYGLPARVRMPRLSEWDLTLKEALRLQEWINRVVKRKQKKITPCLK